MTSRYRNPSRRLRRDTGFSLLEVMVALVVMSVGLLGIAKMQALALSSTSTARMRSLAALEASSLASAMRADRSYWSAVTIDLTASVKSTPGVKTATITSSDTNLAPGTGSFPWKPIAIAGQDLQDWANDLVGQVPTASATVSCKAPPALPAPPAPVGCRIEIDWLENQVASNAQQAAQLASQAAQAGGLPKTSYILYVDP
jgi:type IV pilus assembly protein PilV